jgi:hypothetical protein
MLSFTIRNMMNKRRLFALDMRPVTRSLPSAPQWTRVRYPCSFVEFNSATDSTTAAAAPAPSPSPSSPPPLVNGLKFPLSVYNEHLANVVYAKSPPSLLQHPAALRVAQAQLSRLAKTAAATAAAAAAATTS